MMNKIHIKWLFDEVLYRPGYKGIILQASNQPILNDRWKLKFNTKCNPNKDWNH